MVGSTWRSSRANEPSAPAAGHHPAPLPLHQHAPHRAGQRAHQHVGAAAVGEAAVAARRAPRRGRAPRRRCRARRTGRRRCGPPPRPRRRRRSPCGRPRRPRASRPRRRARGRRRPPAPPAGPRPRRPRSSRSRPAVSASSGPSTGRCASQVPSLWMATGIRHPAAASRFTSGSRPSTLPAATTSTWPGGSPRSSSAVERGRRRPAPPEVLLPGVAGPPRPGRRRPPGAARRRPGASPPTRRASGGASPARSAVDQPRPGGQRHQPPRRLALPPLAPHVARLGEGAGQVLLGGRKAGSSTQHHLRAAEEAAGGELGGHLGRARPRASSSTRLRRPLLLRDQRVGDAPGRPQREEGVAVEQVDRRGLARRRMAASAPSRSARAPSSGPAA